MLETMYKGSFLEFIAEAQYPNKEYQYSDSGTVTHNVKAHDPHEGVVYYINRHGFPGREFIHDADILALGCSVTAGIGVGSNNTWSWMVESMTGMSVNQLGISGASIQVMLSAFLEFIDKFGKPKILLALVPEASRIWVYHHEQPFRHRYSADMNNRVFTSHEWAQGFKTDLRAAQLDLDTCLQASYNALMDMSRACSVMGIKFLFSPYLTDEGNVYRHANIPGFADEWAHVPLVKEWWRNGAPIGIDRCTMHEKLDVPFWDSGIDNPPHPGMHEHLHFAETFVRELSR